MKYSKKSQKNHKTFWGLMLSHVEAIKNLRKFGISCSMRWTKSKHFQHDHIWSYVEVFGFCTSDITICSKNFQIFIIDSQCDNMTPQQVS